ncbi:hypothetical protein CCP3SC1_400008 [Gammaproteobacteria bacterium]
MRTVNQERMSMQGRRLYPQGLLGEMVLGVLASMIIGIGFSILAGAFVLILAGGRVESVSSSDLMGTTFTQVSQRRIVLPHE